MTGTDDRIKAFMRDAGPLEGETAPQVRERLRRLIDEYEKAFLDVDIRAECCNRVQEEIDRCKGIPAEPHWRIVLGVLEGSAGYLKP